MSQFSAPEMQPPVAQKTSGLAIWSLISSLIICCPLTTILGPLLGLIAIPKIGGNPALKGKGLAVLGIVIGVVATAGWGFGGTALYKKAKEMFAVVMEGPNTALTAGFGGDITGFKDGFYGAGANATDAEAQAFLATLQQRYGDFVSSGLDQGQQPAQPRPGQAEAPFPYVLSFSNGDVKAEGLIIFADQQTGQFVMKLGYLTVFDPDAGDLTYPPAQP